MSPVVGVYEHLSLEEAAVQLERRPDTIRQWISDGRIVVLKILGRVRIPLSEIERVKALAEVPPKRKRTKK